MGESWPLEKSTSSFIFLSFSQIQLKLLLVQFIFLLDLNLLILRNYFLAGSNYYDYCRASSLPILCSRVYCLFLLFWV